ncbi:MAG: TIGR00159 family protein [Bacteriovoracaceae bacterium]|nr:TIGR00159 family protein [Bacteriovoracaceae bacterium]
MDRLSEFIGQFTWTDSLDIFIVAIVLYNFLLILQGTRGVQMLFGLMALVILFIVSSSYELYSLNWILRQFFRDFFIIMVILFQDPIRQALVSVGRAGLWSRRRGKTTEGLIEEVVEASWALSKEKLGALIVFEKQNGLLNYANTGTKLDSLLGADLLYGLFQHQSPLHDGAVIISGNRLNSAGCFLPLSKSVEIHRHLGTRHRAALGISELTDCVVITVSEETGKFHLFHRAEIIPLVGPKEMRDGLYRLLIAESGITHNRRLRGDKV